MIKKSTPKAGIRWQAFITPGIEQRNNDNQPCLQLTLPVPQNSSHPSASAASHTASAIRPLGDF